MKKTRQKPKCSKGYGCGNSCINSKLICRGTVPDEFMERFTAVKAAKAAGKSNTPELVEAVPATRRPIKLELSTEEAVELAELSRLVRESTDPSKAGDPLLAALYDKYSKHGLPKYVDSEAELTGRVFARGAGSLENNNYFREGALHHPGKGIYGNGSYLAVTRDDVSKEKVIAEAATYNGDDREDGLIIKALDPDVRLADHKTLGWTDGLKLLNSFRNNPDLSDEQKTDLNHLLTDAGRLALVAGYDGIEEPQGGGSSGAYVVLFDRSQTTVVRDKTQKYDVSQAGNAEDIAAKMSATRRTVDAKIIASPEDTSLYSEYTTLLDEQKEMQEILYRRDNRYPVSIKQANRLKELTDKWIS